MGDPLETQRAAGAVLRRWKRPGVAPSRIGPSQRGEMLRPSLAIEALVTAMRARFQLPPEAERTLTPALADWRDAVGCADPLLVAGNAQGAAGEKHLLPLPMPSWCAWLIESGVLVLEGLPALAGSRVVQQAWLAVVREAELTAVECFPVVLSGRAATEPVDVHLAISPPFLSAAWRGPICLRAAAHRRGGAAVPLWLGAPSSPLAPPEGVVAETVATWAPQPAGPAQAAGWPAGWPRWTVLRVLEGREPQALWDLSALWRARLGDDPQAVAGGSPSAADATLRLGIDLGSTSTVVLEEDSAAAGAIGTRLLDAARPSGFRLLGGDPATAHVYGCGETLLAPAGQLATALCAAHPRVLAQLAAGERRPEEVWLPQAAADGDAPFRADRFKSPELLLLSDWLAALPAGTDPAALSRRFLETYGYLLGRTLATAHAAPLITPEGGSWRLRWPRLGAAEATLTVPQCAWSTASAEPFAQVFDGVGRELCRGLAAAWGRAEHRLVPDPAAARAARDLPDDARHPIEAFVDLGGLTLQITVRVPAAAGRPSPAIAGSSTSYLLGGERLIDAAAYGSAEGRRDAYAAAARRWRSMIAAGRHLADDGAAAAIRSAILDTVCALLRRHVEGTLRRAAPGGAGLRGAGLRLYVLGEGWKLIALDAPDEEREARMLRVLGDRFRAQPLVPGGFQLHRLSKRRLCEGALRVQGPAELAEEAVELQGVDVGEAGQLRQRWFGVVDGRAPAEGALSPLGDDPWWREFSGAPEGSLLRVEQWFGAGEDLLRRGLPGGRVAYDPRRPVLKQWLDLSGPSLVALRVHAALAPPAG